MKQALYMINQAMPLLTEKLQELRLQP